MKYAVVQISGQEWPVSFGMAALASFLDEIGLKISQLESLNDHLSLTATLKLAHTGLVDGGRKAGKPYEKTFEETCDLIDEDGFDAVERILSVFADSLPQGGEKKAKPKAKAKAAP